MIKPIIFVQASLNAAGIILAESSLNFLGLGLDPEIPTLGQLMSTGMTHMFDRPFFIAAPGIVLVAAGGTVLVAEGGAVLVVVAAGMV